MRPVLPSSDTQAIMQAPCNGCLYFSGWSCDYLLIERRRRPCPPGDQCTVRITKTVSRQERQQLTGVKLAALPARPAPSPTKKPWTVQVKHPKPAFKAKPTSRTIFDQGRKKKEKSKARTRVTLQEIMERLDKPEFVAMYEAGQSDHAIGKAVGCCGNSVKAWRQATGRPVLHKGAPGSAMAVLTPHLEAIRAELDAGASDYSLSQKYGVSKRSIGRFRENHDLGPARGRRNEHGNEG